MDELDLVTRRKAKPLFDPPIVWRALKDSFSKLNPRRLAKNPVMFVVAAGSLITAAILLKNVFYQEHAADFFYQLQITVWLWFTVLFANFAEAMAEGRGKAQADSLRRGRREAMARKLLPDGGEKTVAATTLRKNDIVLVKAGEVIPS